MKKKKRSPLKLPAILVGFLMIGLGFVFSLKSLVDPVPNSNNFAYEENSKELSHEEFIQRLVPYAKELQEGYGILPSIIIGQAILESNWGTSELSSKYNNLFGIKAYGDQEKVKMDTQEFVNEQWITIKGEFRVYKSWEESMYSHTMLFVNGVDWSPEKYEQVLSAPDYSHAAEALQEAGYATDPGYADKIKSVIETNQLYQYD
ncbi:glycoside hydrolase family 73 protein [Enterococcus saccharolyticus]|uniref:N-acetylmuramoyl-L-alanine amidase n=1 Tax=Candidatus Enterococcus willemsii TaxID=1857215 RepID=A0ABQ6Z1U7_9ENTE|nr:MULTISPECIES: glycoside hydrolase family 73 protein [Enterococcus]KAF1305272.1 N-acetylmuramoyl-L-alanine amidase [Enterococcus sp. CU12B]MCD5002472.1 glycoside hydrolase family 73 protein [Enterococcus saccharolyticus]